MRLTFSLIALLIAHCAAVGKPRRPEPAALDEPFPDDQDCPEGTTDCGVYCAKQPTSAYYKACVPTEDLKLGWAFSHRAKRFERECPNQYVCIAHRGSRGYTGMWKPGPQSGPRPRIDCVSSRVRRNRLAAAKKERERLAPNKPIRKVRPHERPPSSSGSGFDDEDEGEDEATISNTRALDLVQVPGSPGVYAEFEDLIQSYDLHHADMAAVLLDMDNHIIDQPVRSIEGFLNGEPICSTSAGQAQDDPSTYVCQPTTSFDIQPNDVIDFRVHLDSLPGLDPTLVWDALGYSEKSP